MRFEDRLPPRDWQGMKCAHGFARVIFQVVEIRRVITVADALEDGQVQFHQIFDAIKNAADIF